MSLDHYVSLGRSGLRVSPLCLGAMTFGEESGWGASVAESEAMLDRYRELGGNFVDTANGYTHGHSEAIIGDYFAARTGQRDRTVIATKFMSTLYPRDPNAGGGGRKAVFAALEQSLRRLRTDYVDLYWMHVWDKYTPIEETLDALDDLVRAGKVRYVGFSDTPAWKVAEAQTIARLRGYTPLIALQIEYSLLQRTVEGELVPMARDLGLGITPWGALASGALSGKYTRANHGQLAAGRGAWTTGRLTDATYDLLEILRRTATTHGASVAQVALAWLHARPGVTSIILGARSQAQLGDNLGALAVRLTDEDLDALSAVTAVKHAFPYDFVSTAGNFAYGDAHVDGVAHKRPPYLPELESEVY